MVLISDAIGQELRRTRLAKGWNLIDVATIAHVSTGYLSEVERGKKEPSWGVFECICAALDLVPMVTLHQGKAQLDR